MQSNNKAIIIGSGVAGLATAIRLQLLGYSVTIYEKNSYVGGKLSAFEKDGYYFDAGPSLFTQPQNIVELFEVANEPIENYFTYSPVDVACKYFYENGKVINAYTDVKAFATELQEQLGENSDAVNNYLSSSKKLYNTVGEIFLNNSLHKKKTWLNKKTFLAVKIIKFNYIFKTLYKHNLSKFKSPEAVQLFNRFATYNGSNPYKAPGMLSLIPHLEMNEGVFYPKGGMISITNALTKLANKIGVEIILNTPINRIIQHDGKAKGVVVNNENIYADLIVSNVDVYFTYKQLLNNTHKAKRVLKQERSSSALVFYWGIKKEFTELNLHNILFSKNYKAEFDCLFTKKTLYNDPTVYINITSTKESTQAPDGKQNWFVMVNAPANIGQNWEQIKQQAKANIIQKINRQLNITIEDFIEVEEVLDPIEIENATNSFMGSLYGTSSNSKLAAFLRHPNYATNIKQLYFCGGSVHPGGGIPLCLKSAKIVSELIQSKNKNY
jgi:phytoene desaturase